MAAVHNLDNKEKKLEKGRAGWWWLITLILALRRPRQEDLCDFAASLQKTLSQNLRRDETRRGDTGLIWEECVLFFQGSGRCTHIDDECSDTLDLLLLPSAGLHAQETPGAFSKESTGGWKDGSMVKNFSAAQAMDFSLTLSNACNSSSMGSNALF